MVGVGKDVGDNLPGVVPLETFPVDKNALQLDDAERGVRVVKLDRHLVGEVHPGALGLLEAANDVLQCRAHEKVLLAQTQLLARGRVVVWIENLCCNNLDLKTKNKKQKQTWVMFSAFCFSETDCR